jgi:hypothetical protein
VKMTWRHTPGWGNGCMCLLFYLLPELTSGDEVQEQIELMYTH